MIEKLLIQNQQLLINLYFIAIVCRESILMDT